MRLGKAILATLFLLVIASSVYAYTWNQIDFENTYGTGGNSALLVIDFSDALNDSFAWAVNFESETIGYTEILDVVAAADPLFSIEGSGFINDIIYGSYSSTSGVYWMSNTSLNLGETWMGFAGSVGDQGTVGWVNSASWGDPVTPTVVPMPAAGWLLGSGLLGLIGIRRKRSNL
jgi:hypothetical protein